MVVYKSILRICVFLLHVSIIVCLYEDQIGKFDWKQSYIGKIKHASFDSVKKLIVTTEENVIAALNLKNGQIVWRQVLEDPNSQQIELLEVDQEAVTVSGGTTTWYIRGWDLNAGTLLWEWTLYTEKDSSAARWIASKNQLIHVLPMIGSHLEVTLYETQTGQNEGSTMRISTPWVTDLSQCSAAGTYWVCLSSHDTTGQVFFLNLLEKSGRVFTRTIESLVGILPDRITIAPVKHLEPAFLLIKNNDAQYVQIQGDSLNILSYTLSPGAIVAPNGDQTLLLQFQFNGNNLELKTKDLDVPAIENLIKVENGHDALPKPLTALCRGSACRVLYITNDAAVSLLQLPAGKILWTREEALSHIVTTEFIELPVSDIDASIEHEFDASLNDVIGLFYKRIKSQFKQLSVVLSGQGALSKNALLRDEFGLHKLIIIATRVGKLFALDTLTGEIVWSKLLPNITPFTVLGDQKMILLVQRTARYPPLLSQCSLLAKDAITGNGVIYTFDSMTGESINGVERLPYKIKQAVLTPFEDENHLKGLIVLSENNKVHVYPESVKSLVNKYKSKVFLYSIDSSAGQLEGYSLMHSTNDDLKITPTWELRLGSAKLLAVGVRPLMERVHSQGRVLADRSVLYKYINPNLFALATIADDPLHKHILSILLIDGVSGLVIYSAVHRRAKGPVYLVHSENWLIYSYFSERFRRTEMGAVELYEGASQSNSTAFSSHAISQLPHAEAQAYILPATPLYMQTTLTERGITNKHILVALTNGAITEIPWAFIEPRGSLSPAGPEEGVFPYMPELPLPSEAVLNYNQTLERIRGVQVTPARLESTCLVLVHGLDLFYTRVTPSKTFDLLKEDFDHWLIVVVLVGLIAASYITKYLGSRKALKQAWK